MYYAQQDLGIGIGLKDLDEFSENLQMSFDPPAAALVSKNYVALFSEDTEICNDIFRIGVIPPPPPFPKIQ